MPAPATPAEQLAVIQYCAVRIAKAIRVNPTAIGPVSEDVYEAYLLLLGAAENVDEQTDQDTAPILVEAAAR